MPTLVFVHSPLAPPTIWAPVAKLAQHAGFAVKTPALTDALFHPVVGGPPYLEHCAEAVAREARGGALPFLIAHSGAGAFMAAAAARMDKPEGIVFVDALLPKPGARWRDDAPRALVDRIEAGARDGLAPRWHDLMAPGAVRALFDTEEEFQRFAHHTPRLPLAYFEERAPLDDLPYVPIGYLELSDAYQSEAGEALKRGWPVARARTHHLAMVTDPALVWREIAALIETIAPH